jgi:glycosyltransferase involved in cell wall biosynthesis
MSAEPSTQGDVSVVIPARNAARTIDKTLSSLVPDRSLLAEILLVDDGSTDGTAAAALGSARAHGLPLEILSVRLGSAGAARNQGIAHAKGKFIFMLDADDELVAGGLSLLRNALLSNPGAGLSVGATIRRTSGRPDKLKQPRGYTTDRAANARLYLINEVWAIAMGSALVATAATTAIRFPETIGLDEDTCYWAMLLAQTDVVTVPETVLVYHYEDARMVQRFIRAPRAMFLAIALELDRLVLPGIDKKVIQWRKAWIALRIARQLIKHRMYWDAAAMMRAVRAHEGFRRSWKALQYRTRIRAGTLVRSRIRHALPSARKPRRTLVLTYDPASPPTSGADLRNHRNAEAAAEYPVCLASVRPLVGAPASADAPIRTEALSIEGEARTRSISLWRIRAEHRISRSALARLEALIRDFRPDTVVVEGIGLFRLLRFLRQSTKHLILDMHNVESDLAGQLRQHGATRSAIWAAFGLRRLERQALGIVDRVWVCSNRDRERLLALAQPEIPIDVVANGIPRAVDIPAALCEEPSSGDGFPVILFVGHLGYAPNVDAATRLAGAILPRIRHALPDTRLVLAGRSPGPAVKALAAMPGVELVENPDDVAPLLSQAHLSIVPLAAGGGTRIKILEAMAWGVPVIATPLAAEGLDLAENDEVLLADFDEELAALAIELCLDPERRARQRRKAHEAAWSRFGPQAISNAIRVGLGMNDISDRALSRHATSGPT